MTFLMQHILDMGQKSTEFLANNYQIWYLSLKNSFLEYLT